MTTIITAFKNSVLLTNLSTRSTNVNYNWFFDNYIDLIFHNDNYYCFQKFCIIDKKQQLYFCLHDQQILIIIGLLIIILIIITAFKNSILLIKNSDYIFVYTINKR